jgi:hypothetical protein
MSRLTSALLLVSLVASTAVSSAASAPGGAKAGNLTVETVLAKALAARGNTAPVPSEIEIWTIHELGVDGTLRRVSRGRDWTETRTRDGFVTADGSSRGTTWRQNENGEVIV